MPKQSDKICVLKRHNAATKKELEELKKETPPPPPPKEDISLKSLFLNSFC